MKHILLLLLSYGIFHIHAQKKKIIGKIVDAESVPLEHTKISTSDTTETTFTDQNGYFELLTSQKKIYISHIGYSSDTVSSTQIQKNPNIRLYPNIIGLTNVTVVSQHLKTTLQNNPIAISHVTSKQIDLTQSTNLIDALVQNTPGLNAVQTGPNISKPFIRGLGYNRVLTLFDGVRQEGQQWGDEHGLEIDPYNTDGGDVIKGPASLLYGSDAEAGVISIKSFQPKLADGILHGKYLSEYQTNNGLIGNGASLYQHFKQWYWLTSGSYRLAKNYQNKIDGRVYNTNFKEANFQFGLGHYGKRSLSKLNFTYYNNLQGIPDGSRDSLTRRFTKQVLEDDILDERPVVSDKELNSYSLSPLYQHIQHLRLYADHSIHFANTSSLALSLAWQQNKRREYNHPEYPEQAGMNVRLNTINYTIKYAFAPIGKFDNQIGVNGMYQNNKSLNATDFPIPDYHLFDFGAYAFSRFVSGKWIATGGIRFDNRTTNGKDFYTATDANTGFNERVYGADTTGAYLQFPALHLHFNGISASLGATYSFSDNWHIKVNVARGYRAPNINESAANGLDPGAHIVYIGNRNFKPEFSLQEDLGIEWDYPSFSGGVSLFNNHISNYISLFQMTDNNGNPVVMVPGNWTYAYQQFAARLYGYEMYVNYTPNYIKGLKVYSMLSAVYGKNTDEKYKGKGIDGEYLSLIPPVKWQTDINQDFHLNGKIAQIGMGVNVTVNAAQNRYFALYGTETATPSYTLLGVSANLVWKYSQTNTIDFNFFVANLFDKAYQSNLSRLKYFENYSASPNGHLGIYGMGRNFGLKAIVHF